MIEHTLWEGSSRGGSSQSLSETERFSDWKMCLHVDEWGSWDRFLTDDNTSSLGKGLIDTTNDIIWSLDFA